MKPYQGISAYLSFVVLPFIVSGLIKKPRGVCQTEPVQIVRTIQKSPKCRVNRIQQEWRSVSGATPVFVWIRS